MAERFYINSPLSLGLVVLEGAEARHLAGASRLRNGDAACVFNGDGHEYHGIIREITRHDVTLELTHRESPQRERVDPLCVAAPLPKGDRAQFMIEKLTELGVNRFIPLRCARSVVKPGENTAAKLERYVIEASKQCGRNHLMVIEAACSWNELCAREDLPPQRAVAAPGAQSLLDLRGQFQTLAIGPEGGLTDAEVALAIAYGWKAVGLGPRILRVETAAIVLACLA